jgi:hypothetical protein
MGRWSRGKGQTVVLVLSEAVLVLSEAVIESAAVTRGFYHEGHRGHEGWMGKGTCREGGARESRECREWVRVMIFGRWRAGVSHGGAETLR